MWFEFIYNFVNIYQIIQLSKFIPTQKVNMLPRSWRYLFQIGEQKKADHPHFSMPNLPEIFFKLREPSRSFGRTSKTDKTL